MSVYLKKLSSVPACVPGTGDFGRLQSYLQSLNDKADEAERHSDDSFTAENFDYAKTQNWGAELRAFPNYAAFAARIDAYIDEKMRDPRCQCEGTWEDYGERGACVLPAPKPPKPRAPKRAAAPRPAPKKSDLAIDRLDLHAAPWWGAHPQAETKPTPRGEAIAALDPKSYAPPAVNPFQAYESLGQKPVGLSETRAGFKARFDGKNFILDFHGCKVNAWSGSCAADWPHFYLLLRNLTGNKNQKQQADEKGMVRIVVPARPGDSLLASGLDAFRLTPSQNQLHFFITADGHVQIGGSYRNEAP